MLLGSSYISEANSSNCRSKTKTSNSFSYQLSSNHCSHTINSVTLRVKFHDISSNNIALRIVKYVHNMERETAGLNVRHPRSKCRIKTIHVYGNIDTFYTFTKSATHRKNNFNLSGVFSLIVMRSWPWRPKLLRVVRSTRAPKGMILVLVLRRMATPSVKASGPHRPGAQGGPTQPGHALAAYSSSSSASSYNARGSLSDVEWQKLKIMLSASNVGAEDRLTEMPPEFGFPVGSSRLASSNTDVWGYVSDDGGQAPGNRSLKSRFGGRLHAEFGEAAKE
ncbi:hypothetical protein Leryth_015496 [Lithospermum erythrorhizon]|nr:hypothetical protein Leryth_015496 [Lithospermum erythrorhizon]